MSRTAAVTRTAAAAGRKTSVATVNRALLTKRQIRILDSPWKKTPQSIFKFAETRANQLRRWRKPGTPFLVGQTPVYLPDFTITLLRTPNLPPTQAQFIVPLNFNKFDLRDYLFHVYSVRTFAIRSFTRYPHIVPVERGSKRDLPGKKKHYRPMPEKRMIADLEKPFFWPRAPTQQEQKDNFGKEQFNQMMQEYHGRLGTKKQDRLEDKELRGKASRTLKLARAERLQEPSSAVKPRRVADFAPVKKQKRREIEASRREPKIIGTRGMGTGTESETIGESTFTIPIR